MRAFDLSPRRRRLPSLNVTSLIDVLFLLLIFFMVSSTFVEHPAIELDLPEAGTAESSRIDSLTLSITADEALLLDGKSVASTDELEASLAAAVSDDPRLLLVLEADRRAGYGLVIEALDAARAAGVKRISAFTRLPEE